MRFPRVRTIILAPLVLFALFYLSLVVLLLLDDEAVAPFAGQHARYQTIAIFGASGTAGDGILKAALANPDIIRIHVITRRTTTRIDSGVASGKVKVTLHMNYLDYSAIHEQIGATDAVYWAIGTSSVGVDEETYGKIHVDFPVQFVSEWLGVSESEDISFHYISSSDISADSRMMWAREKVRAENTLFEVAAGSRLRVIAYRPDYIGPTKEEAHIGQNLLYWFFAPVASAVRATQIGQAMFEVTARGSEFQNGDRLGTRNIIRYSDAYERRQRASARASSAGDSLHRQKMKRPPRGAFSFSRRVWLRMRSLFEGRMVRLRPLRSRHDSMPEESADYLFAVPPNGARWPREWKFRLPQLSFQWRRSPGGPAHRLKNCCQPAQLRLHTASTYHSFRLA